MRFLLICSLLLLSQLLPAQALEVLYYSPLSENPETGPRQDYALLTSATHSTFVTKPLKGMNDLDAESMQFKIIVGHDGHYLNKNFTKRTLTSEETTVAKKAYVVTDKLHSMKWTVGTKTKVLGGYNCQEASCTFRGRKYTAWFTSEIPLRNGPWKLGGLPGLILEAYDAEKVVVFLFQGIRKVEPSGVNLQPKLEGKPLTLEDYFSQRGKDVKRFEQFIQAKFNKDGQNTDFQMEITEAREISIR